jgi:hypothetical protein
VGAWGHRSFDNDAANDWAYGLEDTADLSLVESALDDLESVGDDYLDQDVACNALAACEVLARCIGNAGYRDAYTEKVDAWVAAHSLKPSPSLLNRASLAIRRILSDSSELRELWEDSDGGQRWREAIEDLAARLSGSSTRA